MFERLRLELEICVTAEERALYEKLDGFLFLISDEPGRVNLISYHIYTEKLRSNVGSYSGRFRRYFDSLLEQL